MDARQGTLGTGRHGRSEPVDGSTQITPIPPVTRQPQPYSVEGLLGEVLELQAVEHRVDRRAVAASQRGESRAPAVGWWWASKALLD